MSISFCVERSDEQFLRPTDCDFELFEIFGDCVRHVEFLKDAVSLQFVPQAFTEAHPPPSSPLGSYCPSSARHEMARFYCFVSSDVTAATWRFGSLYFPLTGLRLSRGCFGGLAA